MQAKQKTLAKPVNLKGIGLHTGAMVNVTFKPAAEGHGIKFSRTDIDGETIIPALADHVTQTERGTTLQLNDVSISTIEHALATLTGLGIDNVLIELDGPEMPIMDGSAGPYTELLAKAGIQEQEEDKDYYVVTSKMSFKDEEKGIDITIYPDDDFSADVHIDFNSKVIGYQYATYNPGTDFAEEIAKSRTFVFLHELEMLLKNNLIKGGQLDNAIIVVDKQMTQEAQDKLAELFNQPKMEVLPEGILNNLELRYNNEMARHKLLDLIGDLTLAGKPIKGKVIANKPGHFANTEMAKIIRKDIKLQERKPKPPHYDPNEKPLYDIIEIQKRLPHRPPFLLVDRINFMDEWVVTGVKNVTMNEAFFVGHFPSEPVMPGVLQVEAMAQVGAILLLSFVPDPHNYVIYFMKLENIKFKQKVVPGDTLNIRMRLLDHIKRGIAKTRGQVFVGDTLVMEGEFMAQMAKKPEADK